MNETSDIPANKPKAPNRMRWATQRVKSVHGNAKRRSILDRLQAKSKHTDPKRSSGVPSTSPSLSGSDEAEVVSSRRIFVNIPLPSEAKDEHGKPLHKYGRNKIRTSRYTPLSFIPKNLWYQFQNIANVYFLFLIILSFFSIFGASNPGLGAVPLIVIVVVTAIKDAIEDWRRTMLDNELNNLPVYRLTGWTNVNSSLDDVSLWRRFKKANTRFIVKTYRLLRSSLGKKSSGHSGMKAYAERAMAEHRVSESPGDTHSHPSSPFDDSEEIFQDPDHDTNNQSWAEQKVDQSTAQISSIDTMRASGQQNPQKSEPAAIDPALKNQRRFTGVVNKLKPPSGRARFTKDYWKNAEVGDFVRIYNDDQIPADIVILATSEDDGACYVETKNLDGETNLKVRQALHCGESIKNARHCEQAEFILETEHAHANLYQFSGAARWNQIVPGIHAPNMKETSEPINITNLLLRGCSLRNTEWVLGVVVFTGSETKIMMNAGITPSKRSRISRELNWDVIYNFLILLLMCIVSGVVEGTTWDRPDESLDFFEFGSEAGTPALDGFVSFWAAVILYQNLVPISLYISLEIIKTAQAFFIYSDTAMYYEPLDYPCTPKSWNVSDDLGQIEYVFSDKTGTLTQNVMQFKKCTIGGVPYGEAYTEALAGMRKRLGVNVEEEAAQANKQIESDRFKMLALLREMHNNIYLRDDNLTFVAPDFVQDLDGKSGEVQQKANEGFMLALALCHAVVAEKIEGEEPRLEYKAQSPDESALVATARDCGFTVLERSNDTLHLNVLGQPRHYQILTTLEFNSSRKRMSTIVRMPDNSIKLFCKGADSVIYSRLKRGDQSALRSATAEHLEMFAREGLRTLCVAEKTLTETEYGEWSLRHHEAAAAIKDRDEKLESISDEIEQNLVLLGGTAIEDRLQDGVPETIEVLAAAGIKLWVLTGDKVETAINIGFSCNLLSNEMELIQFAPEGEGLDGAALALDRCLAKFGKTGSDHELAAARKSHEPPNAGHAFIIDGDALKHVLEPHLRQRFLLLCRECKAVLCCRVSPSQKAAVVEMVKRGLDVMTLSVGDGANDVAMIQEADIGVGIAGEEGRQAVMSSDYAVAQFRFLQRLILVHGRWSYKRLAETIANFFYKNMVWTFTLFWYGIYNSFDASYLFDYTYLLLYNLAFTSLPIIFMGILDQDVSDLVSLKVPQLYIRGIERKEWTQTKFWLYMGDGIYQSLICFFMPYLLFAPATFVTGNGLDVDDRVRIGVYIANGAVTVANIYILMNTYRWDWLMLVLVCVSILLVFAWTGIYSSFTASDQFFKAGSEVFGTATFWAVTILVIVICLLPRFTAKYLQKVYFPHDVDIIREQVSRGRFGRFASIGLVDMDQKQSTPSDSSEISNRKEHGAFSAENPFTNDARYDEGQLTRPTSTVHNEQRTPGSSEIVSTIASEAKFPTPPSHSGAATYEGRPRPSFDRFRQSFDLTRPSFEASNDFTSAAMLRRMESNNSMAEENPTKQARPSRLRS